MCNLYSITTNQAAIIALFRVINRYVGNLPSMPVVFPDYPAPVVRNRDSGRALTKMRWAIPPPPRTGAPPAEPRDDLSRDGPELENLLVRPFYRKRTVCGDWMVADAVERNRSPKAGTGNFLTISGQNRLSEGY